MGLVPNNVLFRGGVVGVRLVSLLVFKSTMFVGFFLDLDFSPPEG